MRVLPILLAAFWFPASLLAQADDPATDRLRVYLDCPGFCDQTYVRTEITWVDWVLDRQSADLHVLITSQATGGGGRRYQLAFLGRGDEEGHDHALEYVASSDATQDVAREGLTRMLALGLLAFVDTEGVLSRLRVVHEEEAAEESEGAAAEPTEDPWDFWVFSIGADAFVNGESTSRFTNLFGSVSANRVTEAWKLRISANYSESGQRFEFPDTVVEESREDWEAGALAVRSLGEQWALGVRLETGSSSFVNQDFRWSVEPGIEYNVFPYAETSRRSLTLQYLAGPAHFRYEEETIFLKTSETRLRHSLVTRLALVQPWGQWSTSVRGSQFLHDTSKYSVTVSGNFNLRLFRGFSLRGSANYSWIRDQIYLASSGATREEILLRQRQLATSFRYFTSFGIQYRFGSIFNNVVNPRFGF